MVVLHVRSVAPDSRLDEVNPHLLLPLKLNRKPCVLFLQFVQELEERPFLEDLIAVLVFDVSHHLEELGVIDLRVAEDVPERVG